LQALVAVLTGRFRLSKDMAAELLQEVAQIPMSAGAVVNCEQLVSEALAVPYEQAREVLRAQPVLNVDETSWRQGARKAWLWVMAALVGSFYQVTPHRDGAGAEALLGDFGGVLTSDRYAVYVGRDPRLWQVCWSHLKRDWTRMAERGGASGEVGERLLKATRALFRWWHRVRDGTRTREWLAGKVQRLRGEVRRALEDGSVCGHEQTEGTCRDVLGCFESLWTFVAHEGVEPTNNLAERQLRHGVIWRRISFGTDSERGSRFVERVLTVVMTLRQQGRRILDWLAQQLIAWRSEAEGPLLFPQLRAPQAAIP
jgi:transposase